jgi:hypothetical protein
MMTAKPSVGPKSEVSLAPYGPSWTATASHMEPMQSNAKTATRGRLPLEKTRRDKLTKAVP